MPQAFTDVSELTVFADHLNATDERTVTEGRKFVDGMLGDAWTKMRAEVPVDEGETRDHVTVEVDDDGFGGSVGPTNRDAKGRPIGFFIEYGTSDTAPDPFVKRTADWAAKEMPNRAADLAREVL